MNDCKEYPIFSNDAVNYNDGYEPSQIFVQNDKFDLSFENFEVNDYKSYVQSSELDFRMTDSNKYGISEDMKERSKSLSEL